MAVSRLREQVADWRQLAEFDQSSRVMKNIALSGTESKNGYRYSDQALRRAVRLYDQKPVFLDHAEKPADAAARSTRDLVGSIVNPRFEDGRLRGDVRVLDTESGRTFLALADGNSPGVGMSHVVLAQRSVDGAVVERIEDVISVDVVVRPATTSTFRESEDGPEERADVEFQEEGSSTLQTLPASGGRCAESDAGSVGNSPIETLLPRLITLLERVEASLEKSGGMPASGAGVQDGMQFRREANVPADRLVLESTRPIRVMSSPRREVQSGFSRAAFLAAIRGR
ncbi:hypothetical protein AYO47_08605 [Planctomyces sp. SCGC AG-212-M04]|nr:hypothetical protein AYO47_08605 [Planctomyces sp. SCGC AG-212-M04]